MKKLLIAVLTSLMLVGCGGRETTEANNKKEAYVFEVNGTSIAVNQDFSEVSNALGDPQSKFTSPSCAFEGQDDNVYTYASYQITTYTNSADGKEYVYISTNHVGLYEKYGWEFAEKIVEYCFEPLYIEYIEDLKYANKVFVLVGLFSKISTNIR